MLLMYPAELELAAGLMEKRVGEELMGSWFPPWYIWYPELIGFL